MDILFLGYDEVQTKLIFHLRSKGHYVKHTSEPITSFDGYDRVISFGYRHILKPVVLKTSKYPVINLHISYLPWNRGTHPNFWAHYDKTPSGVTIHEIDEGIDTGPILLQRRVWFTFAETTFATTYRRLVREIEDLFTQHSEKLLDDQCQARPQYLKEGTSHKAKDLPDWMTDWNVDIKETLKAHEKSVA